VKRSLLIGRAYLAKLTDIADAFAFEGAEVGRDAGVLQVDDAGEWLVEERADGEDREVAGFGLFCRIRNLASKPRIEAVDSLQPECESWL
jgi:hypothetical protein